LEAVLRQSNKFMMDLVTLARTGTIEMQPEQVEPTEIARQIASEQRRLLGERKIELLISEGLPAVMVHPARLKQVITNLVRNAAKHGCAKDSPRIEIRRCDPKRLNQLTETANNFVWLAVHDNGAGIPASDRDEIFLPGKRLANAHADGTGMGLAIVKKIVDHYGGHVLVDPRVENGTSILFSLPAA
jgi:signal transduction histidine kinase